MNNKREYMLKSKFVTTVMRFRLVVKQYGRAIMTVTVRKDKI